MRQLSLLLFFSSGFFSIALESVSGGFSQPDFNSNLLIFEDPDSILVNGAYYYFLEPFSELNDTNTSHFIYTYKRQQDSMMYFIINLEHKSIIGNIYWYDNGPDYFKEGLCRFLRNGKTGYMDTIGNVVIDPIYDFGSYFKNGIAKIGTSCEKKYFFNGENSYVECEKSGAINRSGELILPIIYENITEPEDSSLIIPINDFDINLAAWQDSLNQLKLPYGTYYKGHHVLKVFPLSGNTKPKQIYYIYSGPDCDTIAGIMGPSHAKRYFEFKLENSKIEINSITPGLEMPKNGNKALRFCKGSWGTYSKLRP